MNLPFGFRIIHKSELEAYESALSRAYIDLHSNNGFSDKDMKTLIHLCHPDKHNNSKMSVDMTSNLLKMRQFNKRIYERTI